MRSPTPPPGPAVPPARLARIDMHRKDATTLTMLGKSQLSTDACSERALLVESPVVPPAARPGLNRVVLVDLAQDC